MIKIPSYLKDGVPDVARLGPSVDNGQLVCPERDGLLRDLDDDRGLGEFGLGLHRVQSGDVSNQTGVRIIGLPELHGVTALQ